MTIKITKRIKISEIANEKCHNFYYGIKGRIYNDDNTKYKRFSFILFFDIFDLQDYFEEYEKGISKKQIEEYVEELIWSNTQYINGFDDCEYFYQLCSQTYERYQ